MSTPSPQKPNAGRGGALLDPHNAVAAMLRETAPVATERVVLSDAVGRVLAEPIRADRDSPACDVSAMDGYALRTSDLDADDGTDLPVVGEVMTGDPPVEMPAGGVLRVFTGGAVPRGANAVVKREDTVEHPDRIRLSSGVRIEPGQHIRTKAENIHAGDTALEAGVVLNAVRIAGLATFGGPEVQVFRKVRIAILVTGNELVDRTGPNTGQVRDSNGPTLSALVQQTPWCELACDLHVGDDPTAITDALNNSMQISDAVVTTGGVSKGDHDYVPAAVESAGCHVLYHGLSMRPGKPNLGAVGFNGQPVFGLPGNPVSAAVGAVALAGPVLQMMSGQQTESVAEGIRLPVHNDDGKTLPLRWYRLTKPQHGGVALVPNRGSGDVVALSRSTGFIEVDPGETAALRPRPWREWSW